MATTPRPVIDSVVRSVCGREVERLVRLTGGGLHETYRVEVPNDVPAVVRIARQPVPWFTNEEHVMAQARGVGVPTPEVLGVAQVDHDGALLSISIQRLMPCRPLDELAGERPASDIEGWSWTAASSWHGLTPHRLLPIDADVRRCGYRTS